MLTELEKRRVIALEKLGWNEHEIAVDLLSSKYPIEYALMRKEIQICLAEKKRV